MNMQTRLGRGRRLNVISALMVLPSCLLLVNGFLSASIASRASVSSTRYYSLNPPNNDEVASSDENRNENSDGENQQRRFLIPNISPGQHRKQQTNHEDEDEVHEWLLRSTSLILGEDTTLELVNGEADNAEEIISSQQGTINVDTDQKVPPHFTTPEEFILNAESVMRAWCQWISQFSNTNGSVYVSKHDADDDGVLRCSAINAAKIVDAILNRILAVVVEELSADKHGGIDWEAKLAELVSCVIDAWANTKNRDGEAVRRAEAWLMYLQQVLGQRNGEDFTSSLSDNLLILYEECNRGVIKTFIRSHEHKHLQKAIGLLHSITEADVGLNLATYNLVLYGLANCEPCLANAEQAEKLLEEMISSNRDTCRPDSNTFRQVIIAWTKSGAGGAAGNARRVLRQMLSDFPMLDPDVSTFNALMTLYIRRGKTEGALSLFDNMTSMQQSGRIGTKPDIYSINLMLTALIKKTTYKEDMESVEELLKKIEERYDVLPDVTTYNLVLDAYAKSHLREAGARCEQLIDSMEIKCRTDRSVAPDAYSFTSTINAIERSRHHEARGSWAEKVFNRMETLHSQGLVEAPTTPVYNALLNALISSEETTSLERAERLFTDIQSSGIANTRTYNTMLKQYAMFERSRYDGRVLLPAQPNKALSLLDEMEHSYYIQNESAIKADKYSYTTVISAIGRSNSRRKAAKALSVLHRMIDSYLEGNVQAKPNSYAFNAVLNAACHTRFPDERLEGFTILCSTLILQKDWAKPDHTTYATFLQGCDRLLPSDELRKFRVLETVMNACVKDGQASELVLKNLKGVASDEMYESLVGRFLSDDGVSTPLQWRKNVDGQDH